MRSRSLCVDLPNITPCCSACGCNNTNVKKRPVIASLPVGETRIKAVHGFVTVEGLDHGWKPSKYGLLCLAHSEESCFEEDASHRIVGEDPHKRRRRRVLKHRAVQTIFSHRPHTSKLRTNRPYLVIYYRGKQLSNGRCVQIVSCALIRSSWLIKMRLTFKMTMASTPGINTEA